MRNTRRGAIDRSDIDDTDDASITLANVDAAIYGKIALADTQRRIVERARFGAFKLTATGLEIGENAKQKDWEEAGDFIFRMESGIQWLIGDWLAYGEDVKWGDIRKLAEALGRDENTLSNYKMICQKIEFPRRRGTLSFGHHEVVYALDLSEQETALNYAEEHHLSVAAFRKVLRGDKEQIALPEGDRQYTDSMPPKMKKFWLRDPSTAKPEDHEKVRQAYEESQRAMRAYARKWGIE